jgi:glycine oxidase
MTPSADAIVVGGGVIGKSVALALAERGAKVELFDASEGSEARRPATRAAAGILGAQMEAQADEPLARLCLESRARFEAFAKRIEAKSGRAVEYRASGVIVSAFDDASLEKLEGECAWQKKADLKLEKLDRAALRELEPELAEDAVGAIRFVDDARVDPRALLDALDQAIRAAGVTIRSARVRRILRDGATALGVEDESGARHAKHVVLAAGSWSTLVSETGLAETAVMPARGQMLELRARPGLLRGVVLAPDAYFSPRDDGRILVGSTVELVGFDDRVTAAAARDLLAAAVQRVPALAHASLSDSWAGLRPYTTDELPLIGPGTLDRLIFATGHFRNGVLLAPITAEIVADLIEGKPPAIDVGPFSPSRLARVA